jgi:hypothetical protein
MPKRGIHIDGSLQLKALCSDSRREEAWPLIEELAEHATQGRFVDYNDDSSAATRSLRRTTDLLSAR